MYCIIYTIGGRLIEKTLPAPYPVCQIKKKQLIASGRYNAGVLTIKKV